MQREAVCGGELVPKNLEANRGFGAPLLPQDIDHFAERADDRPGPAVQSARDDATDVILEGARQDKAGVSSAVWVLLISGALGFRLGMVILPDWQVAVETAQVIAGLVHYPAGNPFYVYHTKVWTILHQICALFLLSGVSEIALSKVVSGLLGMLSLQALSMIVYALSRDVPLAIGSAFLIFFTRVAEYGAVYPIYLMGASHTYGILGLSAIALAAGLLGSGWYRSGAFLVGVAPAIHPSLGAWFALVVVLAALWDFRTFRDELRPAWKLFLAGCALTAISLAVQLAVIQDAASIDPQLSQKYLSAFTAFWDGHRQPVDFTNEGVTLTLGVAALALLWLTAFADLIPRAARFLLRLVVVSGLLGLALIFVSWIPPDKLPPALLILMPGRFLNFNALIAVALLIGLIGAGRHTVWRPLLALFLSVGLLIGNRSMFWEWLEKHRETIVRLVVPDRPTRPLQILLLVAAVLAIGTAISTWLARRARAGRGVGSVAGLTPEALAPSAARLLTLGVLAWIAVLSWGLPPRPARVIFLDRTNSSLFAVAAQANGLLLTGGDQHLVQLRTRRPVLLDGGGLDGLPYALETGPALDLILRDVYDIDLFNPPEEARGRGTIPNAANRAAWEKYSRERWRQIRHAYNVTQVLTDAHWALDLPVAARSGFYVLYEIPD